MAGSRRVGRSTDCRRHGNADVDGNRVAYFGDWTGTVRAVDARTGEKIWSTSDRRRLRRRRPGDHGARCTCRVATLYRLEQATGELEWKDVTTNIPARRSTRRPLSSTTSSSRASPVHEGRDPDPNPSFRGSIGADDAGDRQPSVEFYHDAERRQRAAPGSAIWSTPAIDPKRGCSMSEPATTTSGPTGRWRTRSLRSSTGPASSPGRVSSPTRRVQRR